MLLWQFTVAIKSDPVVPQHVAQLFLPCLARWNNAAMGSLNEKETHIVASSDCCMLRIHRILPF